jgi:hypothetical protein
MFQCACNSKLASVADCESYVFASKGSITQCIAVTEAGSGIDGYTPPNSSENA